MEIEFDAAKNEANITKHGVSFERFVDITDAVVIEDNRFAEERFRIFGLIDGSPYCAAVTMRGDVVRIISLRRAHNKEYRRHGG
jgi:uncharacterized DUF497 family protein